MARKPGLKMTDFQFQRRIRLLEGTAPNFQKHLADGHGLVSRLTPGRFKF